jgi:hypothetical protein
MLSMCNFGWCSLSKKQIVDSSKAQLVYLRMVSIRPKYVVQVYNKEEKKSEHQPKLHIEGKSKTKSHIM